MWKSLQDTPLVPLPVGLQTSSLSSHSSDSDVTLSWMCETRSREGSWRKGESEKRLMSRSEWELFNLSPLFHSPVETNVMGKKLSDCYVSHINHSGAVRLTDASLFLRACVLILHVIMTQLRANLWVVWELLSREVEQPAESCNLWTLPFTQPSPEEPQLQLQQNQSATLVRF